MLEEDVNTSAGLHFLASVQKKTVGSQDASTNTDPGKYLKSEKVCITAGDIAQWLEHLLSSRGPSSVSSIHVG